jgi:hypothetical protein
MVRARFHEVGETGVSEPFLMHVAKMMASVGACCCRGRQASPLALAERVLLARCPVSLWNIATLTARARGIVLDCVRTIWFHVWSERVLHAIR